MNSLAIVGLLSFAALVSWIKHATLIASLYEIDTHIRPIHIHVHQC